ncbi:alpha/beta fold hydrolase [Aliiroseovarius sp. PTFE2010]|uniref:alpha/beta fold hydrolase n=1 Tax=Aliiroseovarius sp. PTFE2010 TaxID=3417190 RepID=UPI003CF9A64B
MIFLYILAIAVLALLLFLAVNARKTVRFSAQAEAAVPPLGQFVDISTGRLHFVDQGSGAVIVMIHGLGGQLRHFTMDLSERLAADHRVIVLDRPGMGYSNRPDNAPASLDAQAGYVIELMDKLGIEDAVIVGHSLGGAISLALALRAPRRVRALALLAPLTRAKQDGGAEVFKGFEIRTNWMRRLIANTLAVPLSIRNQQQTIDQVFGPDPVPEAYTVKGGGLLSLRPKTFFHASRDYVASAGIADQQDRYGALKMPVGILFGTQDRILDHREQGTELVQQFPDFQIEYIDGAGHMLPVTYPERCESFIREVAARC